MLNISLKVYQKTKVFPDTFQKLDQPKTLFSLINKKPITPSFKEIKENYLQGQQNLDMSLKKKIFLILKPIF